MKKYRLLSKKFQPISITIDHSAKQDFMELMEWNEDKFNEHTEIMQDDELRFNCKECGKEVTLTEKHTLEHCRMYQKYKP